MKRSYLLFIGGLFGFLAVALGAVADHVWKLRLEPAAYDSISTALRYMLIHAAMLVGLGLAGLANPLLLKRRLLHVAGLLFVTGICCFSGSIIVAHVLGSPAFLRLAPTGGVCLMLGWLMLATLAVQCRKPLES